MLLAIFLCNLLLIVGARQRQRRYLVYPDGGPARAQVFIGQVFKAKTQLVELYQRAVQGVELSATFIIGLGVPVDLKEASVTVGVVIKFQYDLPTNSTEYTSRIYGFANTVSRDMDGDTPADDVSLDLSETDDLVNENELNSTFTDDSEERDNDTLVDITFDRRKRSLMYTEGGMIDDVNTEMPLQDAIRRQEAIDQNNLNLEDVEPQRMNRWDFYKILEHMTERYGYSGRPCLLRTICEAAEVPFTHELGLLGEIGHVLFTPSTTKDELSHHTDNEYHAAERLGRTAGVDCETLFPDCEDSILSTFTEIGQETLHSFGIL